MRGDWGHTAAGGFLPLPDDDHIVTVGGREREMDASFCEACAGEAGREARCARTWRWATFWTLSRTLRLVTLTATKRRHGRVDPDVQCLAVAVGAESAGAKLWLLKTSGPFPAAAAAVNRLYITLNPPAGSIKLKRTPRLGPVLAQIVALMVKAKKNRLANYGSHVTNHIQPTSHAVCWTAARPWGTVRPAKRPNVQPSPSPAAVGIVALHVLHVRSTQLRTE